MIVERPNPAQLILQAAAYQLDGTAKTVLTSAVVRVYHVNSGGTEVVDLAGTPLTQVGSTNFWRYKWEPASLAVGQYFAEYTLVDPDGATFVGTEDVAIQDFSTQTDLDGIAADIELIKQLKIGTWEIVNNQMIYKNTSGVEIARHNLFDINGDPTNGINMYKREPA